MSRAAGYVVCLSAERQRVFDSNFGESQFAEAVPEFEHSRNAPLVCFVVSEDGAFSHICLGSRGRLAGTDQRRLNMKDFHQVKPVIPTARVLQQISSRHTKKVSDRFRTGGLLSPKAFEEVVAVLSKLSPDTAPILAKYGKERLQRIANLPDAARHALAEQKEAILTAMAIAGIDKKEISGWDVPKDTLHVSFLSGLPNARLREDQAVVNDLSVLPGYEKIAATIHGSTVFENNKSRLTLVLANRLPLEEQTGADLIYYNETFQCFLLVQYKMMEKEGDEYVFRFPNLQLTEEISRMDTLLSEIAKINDDEQADGYRLNDNPFFLKICPRITFDPDHVGLSAGMYLPLDYWKRISVHPALVGPRGGSRLSYRNVRRYFDNTEFINIAIGGWVGTHTQQSSLLINVIRETIQSGRAAIIAINQELDERHRHQEEIET